MGGMSGYGRTLDERKGAILRTIVSHYVRSGEPVGSKAVAERFPTKVSPATVRNEMAVLEDFGFIFQPHTSAGRVPTDAGYRYYVDAWAARPKLSAHDSQRVRTFFGEPRYELEDSLRRTASLLSELTDHAAMVFSPSLERSIVRHLELVKLTDERAMLVMVTNTGWVENHIVLSPAAVDEITLADVAELLNRLIVGTPHETVADTILAGVDRLPLEFRDLATRVADVLREEMLDRGTERVFLEGTSNIVDEHKFSDLETVRQVIGALEHKRVLLELVADALAVERVMVRIGIENDIEEMRACSVITAPYAVDGSIIGTLGIVGPTRMDYRRTIAAVNEVADHLGRMFGGPIL
jgi:heat-inducible transcriptional repressor